MARSFSICDGTGPFLSPLKIFRQKKNKKQKANRTSLPSPIFLAFFCFAVVSGRPSVSHGGLFYDIVFFYVELGLCFGIQQQLNVTTTKTTTTTRQNQKKKERKKETELISTHWSHGGAPQRNLPHPPARLRLERRPFLGCFVVRFSLCFSHSVSGGSVFCSSAKQGQSGCPVLTISLLLSAHYRRARLNAFVLQ